MPKSIIREFDNSTTGSILSSNFSVLVPGYINPEKDTKELKDLAKATGVYYEDSNIYVLNSQAAFTKFIGKYGGNKNPVAPEPEILHPELTGIQKYQTQIKIDEVRDYYWNEETVDYKYYTGTSVEITDSDYNKNGYLLKTFTFDGGNETYKFTPVKAIKLFEELKETGELGKIIICPLCHQVAELTQIKPREDRKEQQDAEYIDIGSEQNHSKWLAQLSTSHTRSITRIYDIFAARKELGIPNSSGKQVNNPLFSTFSVLMHKSSHHTIPEKKLHQLADHLEKDYAYVHGKYAWASNNWHFEDHDQLDLTTQLSKDFY